MTRSKKTPKKTNNAPQEPRAKHSPSASFAARKRTGGACDALLLRCHRLAQEAEALELLLDRAGPCEDNETDPILQGLSVFMRRTASELREVEAQIDDLWHDAVGA